MYTGFRLYMHLLFYALNFLCICICYFPMYICYLTITDPRTQDWFMVRSPAPILLSIGVYLYLVKLGPVWMKSRKSKISNDCLQLLYGSAKHVYVL